MLGAAGGDEDVGPGADQRAGGLEPDAGVAAGDDGEPPGEVDALDDLGGGAGGAEAGADGFLRGAGPGVHGSDRRSCSTDVRQGPAGLPGVTSRCGRAFRGAR